MVTLYLKKRFSMFLIWMSGFIFFYPLANTLSFILSYWYNSGDNWMISAWIWQLAPFRHTFLIYDSTLQVKCHLKLSRCVILTPLSCLYVAPTQPGCVTTSSSAAKMAGCVSTTSAATVPRATQACSARSAAASRSWGAAGAPTRARPPWRPRPPPGCCCCCCWARRCWERPPAGPPRSKETRDLVGVISSPPPSTLTSPHPPLSNNQQPFNKNHHELFWTVLYWACPPPDSMDTRADNKGNVPDEWVQKKNFSFNFKEYIEMKKKTYTSKNARYYKRKKERLPNKS